MSGKPIWEIEGRDWPNRGASGFVDAAGMQWHVQQDGQGPDLLLLHGTGAATHSWRDLLPRLSADFRVVAPDLPGHGFTEHPPEDGFTLPGMAARVAELMTTMHVRPDLIVAHSAGAAVAIRMALDGAVQPKAIVAFNAALLPFPGAARMLFPALAKLLFLNPFTSGLAALRARDQRAVAQLLSGVGSSLSDEGAELYGRLFRCPGHVDGVLRMMANWDLASLEPELRTLQTPLFLVVGGNDKAVPPRDADAIAQRCPTARVVRWADLGHLAHEEAPDRAAALILDTAKATGPIDA